MHEKTAPLGGRSSQHLALRIAFILYSVPFLVSFEKINSQRTCSQTFLAVRLFKVPAKTVSPKQNIDSISFIFPKKNKTLFNLKYSTSSFRYPCLVHVLSLIFIKAWTISSSAKRRSQRFITVFHFDRTLCYLHPAYRGNPVSTGLRRVAYSTEFVIHILQHVWLYQVSSLYSRIVLPNC